MAHLTAPRLPLSYSPRHAALLPGLSGHSHCGVVAGYGDTGLGLESEAARGSAGPRKNEAIIYARLMVLHSDPGFPGPSLFILSGDVVLRAVPFTSIELWGGGMLNRTRGNPPDGKQSYGMFWLTGHYIPPKNNNQ